MDAMQEAPVVLVSINPDMPDEEIVRIDGYRWEIEVLFKMCKQHLRLSKETQSRDYDALQRILSILVAKLQAFSVFSRELLDTNAPKVFILNCLYRSANLSYLTLRKPMLY